MNRFAILWALPLALASCAYASDYVVPNDSRARVIWLDGEPRAVVPQKSGACELATREAAQSFNPPEAVSRCTEDGSCGQARYEPWIFIDGHPHPPYPFVGLQAHEAHVAPVPSGPSVPLHPGDPVPHPGGMHQASPAPPKGSSGPNLGSGSSSSSSSLGDMKELAVVVAVLAILTMPAVAIALANSRPESETGAASAVDEVNAYNDLVRSPGSACSPVSWQPTAPPLQDSPAAVVPDALPAGVPPPPPAPEGQR